MSYDISYSIGSKKAYFKDLSQDLRGVIILINIKLNRDITQCSIKKLSFKV